MKRLKIEYGDLTLFDGEVDEVIWNDSDNGVSVVGKLNKPVGQGLIDMLTAASKKATEDKKLELMNE